MASGAFAAHFATISDCDSPFFIGRSRNSGGFFGFGDHAAADAKIAFVKKSAFATSAGSRMASARGFGRGLVVAMQQGLSRYMLENTSGCFIPMRIAPYPPIEFPAIPRA